MKKGGRGASEERRGVETARRSLSRRERKKKNVSVFSFSHRRRRRRRRSSLQGIVAPRLTEKSALFLRLTMVHLIRHCRTPTDVRSLASRARARESEEKLFSQKERRKDGHARTRKKTTKRRKENLFFSTHLSFFLLSLSLSVSLSLSLQKARARGS